MQAFQFRIARPTNNLAAIRQFYHQGLDLPVVGEFSGHEGYDGLMLGLPDGPHHLEFTAFKDPIALPLPTKEHLLVFYFDTPDKYKAANERLQQLGYLPVTPENPYWASKSFSYEDPDKWRVVLFNGVFPVTK